MKKKGFTLIELLAIIVILAIIALIAVPVVLNIIDKAKVSSYERSSENILDAARLYYNESILDKDMVISETENVYDKVINNLSGDTPDDGEIYITKDGQISLALKYGGYCFKKDKESDKFTRTEGEAECVVESTISYKCKRATELHTDECKQTGINCYAAGYTTDGSKGTTRITYGNKNITEGTLTSGDAFDCDVDGTGYNHRFYYITEFTSNNEEYAVLVYSNNTIAGVADNGSSSLVAYDSSKKIYMGPVDAITNLPTIAQWSNISLSSTTRAITTKDGGTTIHDYTLPTKFSYEVDGVALAARLLTHQEIATACGQNIDSDQGLDGCSYLFENTQFSNSSFGTAGYWIETPMSDGANIYATLSYGNYMSGISPEGEMAVRPAIEVLKTEISY